MRRRRVLKAGLMAGAIGLGVYGTNSLTGERVSVAWTRPTTWVNDVASDRERAYVTDDTGITAVSLSDGSVEWEADERAVFLESMDGMLLCPGAGGSRTFGLDPATGDLRWTWPRQLLFRTDRPVATGEGTVFALDAETGEPRWRRTDATEWSIVAVSDTDVYAVATEESGQATLHALSREDGSDRWQRAVEPRQMRDGLIAGKTLYVGRSPIESTGGGAVSAFDTTDGRRKWDRDLGGILSDPWPRVVTENNLVLDQSVTDGQGDVCVLDAESGTIRWHRSDFEFMAAAEGRIALERKPGHFIGVSPGGETRWSNNMNVVPSSSIAGGEMVTARLSVRWRADAFLASFKGTNVLTSFSVQGGQKRWTVHLEEPFDTIRIGPTHAFAVTDDRVTAIRIA